MLMKNKHSMNKVVLAFLAFLIFIIIIVSFFNESYRNQTDEETGFSILFLGDFMIGDAYSGDASLPFTNLKVLFENKQDIIVNIETAITDKTTVANPDKSYNYKINSSVVEELKRNNITLLNLANNHMLDYGEDGLNDTLHCLQNYDLSYFGAGYNETNARTGVIRCYENYTKIGYLGYFEYRETYDQKYHFYAKSNISGVAELNRHNLESDILQMKEKTDIIIVSFHIGSNYDINIYNNQKEFAHYAIDLGADAVVCHSAHIVLPVELYKGKMILYSIGNFIFTTPGRFHQVEEVYHTGMGAEFIFKNKEITTLKLTPFKTNNKVVRYQPCFLNNSEIQLLSDTIIPPEIPTTVDNSSIILHLYS